MTTTGSEEKIFNEEMNMPVVHEALRWYLASQRKGTHAAKTRAEVSGGGVKPWRQKGTGRARAGSIRSPLWRKGGVIFPPKPRSYAYSLPRKVRKLAYRVVLSELYRSGRVKIFEKFSLPQPKTKEGAKFLKEAAVEGKILVVMGEKEINFERGIRNLRGVRVVEEKDVNIHDLLDCDWLLLDKEAVAKLEKRLAG